MNDTYSAASGEGIYAGMVAPDAETALETFIAAMSPNSWAQYTGTNINEMRANPATGSNTGMLESSSGYLMTNWTNKFGWHRTRKFISGVGTSNGFFEAGGGAFAKHLTFSAQSNEFDYTLNPVNYDFGYGHCYDANCSNFVNDRTWYKLNNNPRLIEYDAANDSWDWSDYTLDGIPTLQTLWMLECHPDHNALYCLEGSGRLVKFDTNTGVRTLIGTYSGITNYPIIVRAGEYVVFGGGSSGTSLYKIDASGNVTLVTDTLPVIYNCVGESKVVPHPDNSNRLICISSTDNIIRVLDVDTGTFTDVGTKPTLPSFTYTSATSIAGSGGIAYIQAAGRVGGATTSKFWIYKV